MCALKVKIACNGIKPKKSEVYLLAAELVETEEIKGFRAAIIEAFKSYDYYYDGYYLDDYYYYDGYDYYFDYCYFDAGYYYGYDYYSYSLPEKVIALLLLSAMFAEKGE